MTHTKQSFTAGVLYMLLSATGLALTGLLGQASLHKMTLVSLMFWRFLLSAILCWIFLWMLGKHRGLLQFSNLKMHLLRAFFGLIALYSFYFYIEVNTLFNAIVLLNTGPLFIPLIERFILREKVGKSTWVGVIVSFIGMLLVLQPSSGIFSTVSLIGLLAGVAQGASQVVFGINSKTERADISVLYLFIISTLISAIPYLLFETTWRISSGNHGWIYLIMPLLAIAGTCNQLARAEAYQHSTPSGLASFLYFSILVAGILGWAVYDEIPNTLSLIGAGLVILGGLLKIVLRHYILKRRHQ